MEVNVERIIIPGTNITMAAESIPICFPHRDLAHEYTANPIIGAYTQDINLANKSPERLKARINNMPRFAGKLEKSLRGRKWKPWLKRYWLGTAR
jgi:hypothetical protein